MAVLARKSANTMESNHGFTATGSLLCPLPATSVLAGNDQVLEIVRGLLDQARPCTPYRSGHRPLLPGHGAQTRFPTCRASRFGTASAFGEKLSFPGSLLVDINAAFTIVPPAGRVNAARYGRTARAATASSPPRHPFPGRDGLGAGSQSLWGLRPACTGSFLWLAERLGHGIAVSRLPVLVQRRSSLYNSRPKQTHEYLVPSSWIATDRDR